MMNGRVMLRQTRHCPDRGRGDGTHLETKRRDGGRTISA